MTKRIGIVVVFLVGCAVGGGASKLVVPPASAQQAATLPRMAYTCVTVDDDDIEATANQMGREAWEMTGLTGYPNHDVTACFKRTY
jgi:hypothetical protein